MKNRIEYYPEPMDTSDIELPEELEKLTEKLAKNVHDVWAVGKLKDGWKLGPELDAAKKTTPLLIPYEDLSENQKQYDRSTAIETLKLIIRLGYSITSKQGE